VAAVLIAMALVVSACSGGVSGGSGSADPEAAVTEAPTTTEAIAPTTPPTTTIPTTTTVPPTFPLAASVAFLGACTAGGSGAGACSCALSASAGLLSPLDLRALEDSFSATGEWPEVLAGELAACRSAPPPRFDPVDEALFLATCTQGSSRLDDPCSCALSMAEQIVPPALLVEYSEARDVSPSMVDLVNECI